jgi:hypothetical protein
MMHFRVSALRDLRIPPTQNEIQNQDRAFHIPQQCAAVRTVKRPRKMIDAAKDGTYGQR